MSEGCGKCRFEAERSDWLDQDETWSVMETVWTSPTPVQIIPGMVTLHLRRHATVFELTPGEWRSLGPLIGRIVHAIRDATDAECVYYLALGEGVPHFHINFLPRGAEIPPEERGIGLFLKLAKYTDEDAIPVVAARVGELLRASRTAPAPVVEDSSP